MSVIQQTQPEIMIADLTHVDVVTELFVQYRQFYGQPANRPESRHFIFDRTINHESVIYLAYAEGVPVGFAQLYPSWSSASLQSLWILNDLYVAPDYRQRGIARALINESLELCRARGDKGLLLETMPDNTPARKLYESLGFRQDESLHYHLHL